MEDRHRAAANALFRGIAEDAIDSLLPLLTPEEHVPGDVVSCQGDSRIHLIVEGRALVRRRVFQSEAFPLRELTPGDFYGALEAFLGKDAPETSLHALTGLRTLTFQRDALHRLVREHPAMAENIITHLSRFFWDLSDRFERMVREQTRDLERMVRERTAEIVAAHRKVKQELLLARGIQRSLMPDRRIEFPGITASIESVPSEELGGDVAGAFRIDEMRIGIYGGDLCGHGISSAMLTVYVRKLVESALQNRLLPDRFPGGQPGAVLSEVNRTFMEEINHGDPETYLTLFLGVLDLGTLRLEYSSAGTHVPPLLLRGGCAEELYRSSDFPIGFVEDHRYGTFEAGLAGGDILLVMSDGLVEASRDGEPFGIQRSKTECLRILKEKGLLDLADLIGAARGFLGGKAPEDDICLMSLALHGPLGDGSPTRL